MTCSCKLCGKPFISFLVEREQALQEIMHKHTEHLAFKHKEEMAKVGPEVSKIAHVVIQYFTMERLLKIPDSEEWILDQMDTMQNIVMSAIGYDPLPEDGLEEAVPAADPVDLEPPQALSECLPTPVEPPKSVN